MEKLKTAMTVIAVFCFSNFIKTDVRLTALLLIGCLFAGLAGECQRQAENWYFGYKAAVNFRSGSPRLVDGSTMRTEEGVATISDKKGNLLFYTNGVTIWNRNNETMENGSGLAGDISTTQSALIVPHPANDSLYYVFTLDFHVGNKGMNYSIVNINASNGLGKVLLKNEPLSQGTTEKLTAVHRCNNKDVWVVVRLWNSGIFHSYLVDQFGLKDIPVVSTSPYVPTGALGKLGSMKISPDATKIAAAHAWDNNYVELADFSNVSGAVTNFRKLLVSPPSTSGLLAGPYGIEFSPDSRYLYVFATYNTGLLYQFDLQAPDIQGSRQLIAEVYRPVTGSLQLGLDQKIYVTNAYDSSLSVIASPNLDGYACDFQRGVIPLSGGSSLGLPNFITSYFRPDFGPGEISATGCGSGTLNFSFNRVSAVTSMKWNFGDPASGAANESQLPSPSHAYSATGFYTVTLITTRNCVTDTIVKKVYSGNLQLNLDDAYRACRGDSFLLSVPDFTGADYSWSTGERGASIKVATDGLYKVTVDLGCMVSDSAQVSFSDRPVFNLGQDQFLCNNAPVTLSISAMADQYQWSTGSTAQQITIDRAGVYWAKAVDLSGTCTYTDSIIIDGRPVPRPDLGRDTTLCSGESLILHSGISGNYPIMEMTWQNGSAAQSFAVNKQGLYYLRVSTNCGVQTDSIFVGYSNCEMGVPNAFTPNGDGRNDLFRPKYGYGITGYKMMVFNRFGQKVFETSEQAHGWDGRLGGKMQPAGTYVWQIHYTEEVTGKRVDLKGTVTLIR